VAEDHVVAFVEPSPRTLSVQPKQIGHPSVWLDAGWLLAGLFLVEAEQFLHRCLSWVCIFDELKQINEPASNVGTL